MTDIQVRLEGLDQLRDKFGRLPPSMRTRFGKAGLASANAILDTKGLRNYPPQTAANMPPTPYYIRGVGTQYKSYNAGNSEQYGQRWNIAAEGMRTTIGNSASYAPYLAGEFIQARHMASIGWIKLIDGAKMKLREIGEAFAEAVAGALKDAGLI